MITQLAFFLQLCLIVFIWRCQIIVSDGLLLAHHRLSRLGKILRYEHAVNLYIRGCVHSGGALTLLWSANDAQVA